MNIFNTDDGSDRTRAQVGIGTLIVFIAMVLVAAIAAGVLINTAGFLQTQAEDTGTESTQQVADNLNVITEVGNVSADDNINELRIGVQPAAGSDDVNLAELTMQYVSDDEFANIIVGSAGETDEDEENLLSAGGDASPDEIGLDTDDETERFLIDPITAEDESDVVMTDNADRYELVIPLADDLTDVDYPVYEADSEDAEFSETVNAEEADQGELAPLQEGADVEITITTEVGAQTVSFMQVPDSLAGDDAGSTVNL